VYEQSTDGKKFGGFRVLSKRLHQHKDRLNTLDKRKVCCELGPLARGKEKEVIRFLLGGKGIGTAKQGSSQRVRKPNRLDILRKAGPRGAKGKRHRKRGSTLGEKKEAIKTNT